MACNLPHTVEEFKDGIQKQIDGDNIRNEKIYELSEIFSQASTSKEDPRKQYAKCKDISSERRDVIDKFLAEEGWKDHEMKRTLGRCVSQIQDNISHKICWMHKENTIGGSVSQQLHQLWVDEDEPVDEHGFTARQHHQWMRDEKALREIEEEQARVDAENAMRQQELDELFRQDEAHTELFRFGVREYPEYDSACGEYSD